jgi:hypothetical protein
MPSIAACINVCGNLITVALRQGAKCGVEVSLSIELLMSLSLMPSAPSPSLDACQGGIILVAAELALGSANSQRRR